MKHKFSNKKNILFHQENGFAVIGFAVILMSFMGSMYFYMSGVKSNSTMIVSDSLEETSSSSILAKTVIANTKKIFIDVIKKENITPCGLEDDIKNLLALTDDPSENQMIYQYDKDTETDPDTRSVFKASPISCFISEEDLDTFRVKSLEVTLFPLISYGSTLGQKIISILVEGEVTPVRGEGERILREKFSKKDRVKISGIRLIDFAVILTKEPKITLNNSSVNIYGPNYIYSDDKAIDIGTAITIDDTLVIHDIIFTNSTHLSNADQTNLPKLFSAKYGFSTEIGSDRFHRFLEALINKRDDLQSLETPITPPKTEIIYDNNSVDDSTNCIDTMAIHIKDTTINLSGCEDNNINEDCEVCGLIAAETVTITSNSTVNAKFMGTIIANTINITKVNLDIYSTDSTYNHMSVKNDFTNSMFNSAKNKPFTAYITDDNRTQLSNFSVDELNQSLGDRAEIDTTEVFLW